MSADDIPPVLHEPIVVRLVPVSADQIRVLESLESVFASLYIDFQRDLGSPADDVAGGLHRIKFALGAITTYWREAAEDLAAVEGWRAALERIRDEQLDTAQAQSLAAQALG